MRLIVNCSVLTPPLTGIGHYTREILLRLIDDPGLEELEGYSFHRWLTREEIRSMLVETPLPKPPGKRSFAQIIGASVFGRELYRFVLSRVHRNRFSKRSKWVYWETNYIPLPFQGKTMTMVYDLSHIRYPQFHPESRVAFFNAHLPDTIHTSSVVTISDFSASEIAEVYGIEKSKIIIIPPGISPDFHPRNTEENQSFRSRYALPSQYLLSVATLEPRKNLKTLCLAYASLDEDTRRNVPLVLAGAKGWLNDELEGLISPLENQGHIIRLGYVPANDLPLLYAASKALCYLSLYEGYGMPIAEAIASGIPVVTSNRTAMPEAGGNRAWYADPESVDSIVQTLRAMLDSENPLLPSLPLHYPPPVIHTWESAAASLKELVRFCYNSVH